MDQPPESDEIEISVFARGVGECIVAHVGSNDWIVIDSFMGPDRRPIASKYLESIGVPAAEAVKLLVLTHWHDDHVRGATDLVKECGAANVAFPASLCRDELKQIIRQYAEITSEEFSNGVRELRGVVEALNNNKARRKFAITDRVLHERAGVRIDALSPSDEDIELFLKAMADWNSTGAADKRLSRPMRNDTSVALSVRIGDDLMLLGADLEVRNKLSGWQAVHDLSWGDRGRATLFKIAHHGSITGHYDGVWADMLVSDVTGVLSPYGRGVKKLPSRDDIDRLAKLSPNIYSAGEVAFARADRQHRSVDRTLAEASINLYKEPNTVGHARFRKKLGTNPWIVDLAGTACDLAKIAA